MRPPFFLMSVVFATSLRAEAALPKVENVTQCPGSGSHFFQQPAALFTLMLSCEDALGKNFAILFTGQMKVPTLGAWKIDERYWSDKKWNASPTSFLWIPDNRLLVSNDDSGGEPGIFMLDLMNKKSSRVVKSSPKDPPTLSFQIKSFDAKSKTLEFVELKEGQTAEKIQKITLK